MAVFPLCMGWQMVRISVKMLDRKRNGSNGVYDKKSGYQRDNHASVMVRCFPVDSFL